MRAARLSALLLLVAACVDDPGDVDVETVAQPLCITTTTMSWRTPVNLGSTTLGAAEWPHVAASAGGTAMVVWLDQRAGGTIDLKASRMTPGVFAPTWTALPDPATFAGANPYLTPEVAIDGSGRAMVLWVQHNGTTFGLHARRYDPSTGWGTDTVLDTGGTISVGHPPQFSIDGDGAGNFLAVWDRRTATGGSDVRWSRFTAGAWSTAANLENSAGFAWRPVVRMAADGKTVVIWIQEDVERRAYTRRFDPATATWGAITLVDAAADGFVAKTPNVAVNASGAAVVSWIADDLTIPEPDTQVWTATSEWNQPWRAALRLEENASVSFLRRPGTAIDGALDSVVVWTSLVGSIFDVHAQRMRPDGTTASAIATLSTDDSEQPSVHMIANGNGHAVWRQLDPTSTKSILASRLVHRAATFQCPESWSWTSAAAIETAATAAGRPSLAIFPSGAALAVWFQGDASPRQIHVAHFR